MHLVIHGLCVYCYFLILAKPLPRLISRLLLPILVIWLADAGILAAEAIIRSMERKKHVRVTKEEQEEEEAKEEE